MSGTPGTADGPRTSPVQSVDRAVTILEVLAELGESGVTEISQRLDVHKSTAFRLVTALESRGLVEQVGDRGKYRLGMAVVRLAGAVTEQLDVARRARPACEALAAATGETVNLAVADGDAAINVDQVRGTSSVVTRNWVGERTPLHATSSGKVLMAFCPPVRAAGLTERLRRFTDATVVRGRDLEEALGKIAVDGYAVTQEELEVGLNAVAAPVRGADGTVLAALSVSGPSYRLTPERLLEVAPEVVAAAETASANLGWRARTPRP
ncbi:IclR family transcriptional regulator [Kineococcus aurantiacus]|uniref:Glycerol operon regulatory protein n=1 Tax=Kineococcus aurantiacus TaxID=37633 RepID=A0A7Y9DQG1_9ACTN|nr:IclR family transcriptional regulator [Kineococcus aurantiacus]NYD24839.1 DNA-binding IclR family transcriptional regulator [Kineococcus aurantiacus]